MSRRYKLAELAAEVGVNIRTITGWVNKGALPRAGRGPMVAYDEAYRMRFLAVARLNGLGGGAAGCGAAGGAADDVADVVADEAAQDDDGDDGDAAAP